MRRTDELRQLVEYSAWATGRLLDAAAALTDEQFGRDLGSSFRSVRDTLVHIMSADWVWLSRLQGVSPTAMPADWKGLDRDGIAQQWPSLYRRLSEYVGGRSDTELDEPLGYRNLAGEAFASTPSQIIRHVVNHATYHRGQVTTMLRQLGHAAPATDLIAYYRTVAPSLNPIENTAIS